MKIEYVSLWSDRTGNLICTEISRNKYTESAGFSKFSTSVPLGCEDLRNITSLLITLFYDYQTTTVMSSSARENLKWVLVFCKDDESYTDVQQSKIDGLPETGKEVFAELDYFDPILSKEISKKWLVTVIDTGKVLLASFWIRILS